MTTRRKCTPAEAAPAPDAAARAEGAPSPDERRRLQALAATGLLDSPPEAAFERITAMACRLLGVPVSLVSLVDADRQFFKSARGLPEPWQSWRQTPMSHSFCRHAVSAGTPLAISDARNHELVHDNPAIVDLGVVGYLGVPLRTPDGHAVGTLCAIDPEPHPWSDAEVQLLTELAANAMSEIALRLALADSRRANRELAAREREFRATFEGSGLGQAQVELQGGGLLQANRKLHALLGYPAGALIGRSLYDLTHPDDLPRTLEALTELRDGERDEVAFDKRYLPRDGSVMWARVTVTLLRSGLGRPLRFLAAIEDITERRRAQTALRQLNATLEQRVGERTQQVRVLAGQLTRAEQHERQRIAQLLHDDLQQELYAARFALHGLRQRLSRPGADGDFDGDADGDADGDFDEGFGEVDALLQGAITSTRTVTTRLGPPLLPGTELRDDLERLTDHMRSRHGLRVRIEGHVDLGRDGRELLYHLARELLFNVVKHAHTDHAELRIAAHDGEVALEVRDDGAGFDPAALSRRAGDAGPSGTGLGLRGLRERLQLFGGHLEIHAAPGAGSRLRVTVPRDLG